MKPWVGWSLIAVAALVFRALGQKQIVDGASKWTPAQMASVGGCFSMLVFFVVLSFDRTVSWRVLGQPRPLWLSAGVGVLSSVAVLASLKAFKCGPTGPVSTLVASHVALVSVAAWALLGEKLTVTQITGTALVVLGVALLSR